MRISTDLKENNIKRAASPVIKKFVYDLLSSNPDRPIQLKQIKAYVEEETEKVYTHGSFSGAMRDLIEETNGRIVNVERGYYVYLQNFKKIQLLTAFDDFFEKLDMIATDNILELTDEDISTIRQIPLIKQRLNKIKMDLRKK